ncbi:MAG TPA: PAS domain-containing protein [Polyangiaceae bacterium]|nr:PAS domain-containing protein [Polyangiaceae bacterium]
MVSARGEELAELRRLARAYHALSLCQGKIVRATSELEMLESVCRTLVEVGGYRLAWVGYAERDEARTVRPVASAGEAEGYVDSIRVSWADSELGKGPSGTAIRTRQPSINRNTRTNPDFAPWRDVALQHGFESSIALPLAAGDETLGALAVYASEPDAFDTDECSLLVRFAEDLAFGMSSLRAKQDLREATLARARFAILDEAPGGFMALGRDWRLLYVNAAGARKLGHTPESLIGRDIWEAFPPAVGGPFWHAYHRAMDAREVVEFEEYYAPLDGSFEVRAYPIEFGIGVYFSEVSERNRLEAALRESEERFRQLAENIQEVFWLTDVKTRRVIYVSPAFEIVWGRSRQSLYDDPNTWFDAIHPEDREGVEQSLVRPRSRQDFDESYRIVHPDGTTRWVRARSYPVRDKTGHVYRIAGVAQDVTDHRNLEEQFRQAQKMEAVGRLAGGVAHDFNNLLSVILSYSRWVAEKLMAGDPLLDDVREVEKAGLRAAELTSQLLAFSRQQVLQPRVIDLNESIGKVDRMLRRVLGEDIELTTLPGASLWPVLADPGQIEQILMNLAVNARDAMPHGGKLTVETANVELDESFTRLHSGTKAGPHVMLAMSDTGIGMDKATLARIFEPFYTTKGTGKGTGLGLSTVFAIVKRSGGSIWVQSEPGKGTTFKIWLPRTEAKAEERRAPPQAGRARRGAETLLVVEDDPQVRQLLDGILREEGYAVLLAASAADALRLVDGHAGTIHALVTDVVMPGMNGIELAERLKQRLPGLKVLCMSGYADDAVVGPGRLDPDAKFLQKPVTPSKLSAMVRETLDS